jgi:uncharacterized protein YecT (DUF1311 family)
MMRRVILVLVTLILGCGSVWAQLPVTGKTIVRTTGKLKLDIHYPQTGRAALDRIFADYAKSYAADPDLNATSEGANSGAMSYEIKRNDAQIFSVQVSTYSYYASHAHGMPDAQSYSFLMPDGAQVFLPELVDGQRGLDRISQLAIADLTRQLGTSDLGSIRNGAAPQANSFANFAWLPDALELTFLPYQVAAYAAGTRTVRIPFSELADVIREDPRAPAPSFPCASARSRIEKAICADAGLARQDRQMAEYYAARLNTVPAAKPDEKPRDRQYREYQQTHHDAQVTAQRAWLVQRNKDCATAGTACLMASYRARQAALHKETY